MLVLGYRWPMQDEYEKDMGPLIDPVLVSADGSIPFGSQRRANGGPTDPGDGAQPEPAQELLMQELEAARQARSP